MARRRRPAAPSVDGLDIPPDLLDAAAVVWHDRGLHAQFMAAHGWSNHLDVRDRMGPGAPPAARRQAAVAGWAEDVGITDTPHGHADWHRLRAMGLYP